jgi:hypothetical protein
MPDREEDDKLRLKSNAKSDWNYLKQTLTSNKKSK